MNTLVFATVPSRVPLVTIAFLVDFSSFNLTAGYQRARQDQFVNLGTPLTGGKSLRVSFEGPATG